MNVVMLYVPVKWKHYCLRESRFQSINRFTFHDFILNGILKILTSLTIAERFPSFLLYFPFVERLFFHFAKEPPAGLKMWIGPDLQILQPRYYSFWWSTWKAGYTYKILLKNVFENSSCYSIHTTRFKDYNYISYNECNTIHFIIEKSITISCQIVGRFLRLLLNPNKY